MFDMKLFKLPTFSGGPVAAFGLSASIFSMLLYLVLYLPVGVLIGPGLILLGAGLLLMRGSPRARPGPISSRE